MEELTAEIILQAVETFTNTTSEVNTECSNLLQSVENSPFSMPFLIDLLSNQILSPKITFIVLKITNSVLSRYYQFIDTSLINGLFDLFPRLLETNSEPNKTKVLELMGNAGAVNNEYFESYKQLDQQILIRIYIEALNSIIKFDKSGILNDIGKLLQNSDSSNQYWLDLMCFFWNEISGEDIPPSIESIIQCIDTTLLDTNYISSFFRLVDAISGSCENVDCETGSSFRYAVSKIVEFGINLLSNSRIDECILIFSDILDMSTSFLLNAEGIEIIQLILNTTISLIEHESSSTKDMVTLACNAHNFIYGILLSDEDEEEGFDEILEPYIVKFAEIIHELCNLEELSDEDIRQLKNLFCNSQQAQALLEKCTNGVDASTLIIIPQLDNMIIPQYAPDILSEIIKGYNEGNVLSETLSFINQVLRYIQREDITQEILKIAMSICMVDPSLNNIKDITYIAKNSPQLFQKISQETEHEFIGSIIESQSSKILSNMFLLVLIAIQNQPQEIQTEYWDRALEAALTKGYSILEAEKTQKFYDYILDILSNTFEPFDIELYAVPNSDSILLEFLCCKLQIFVENVISFLDQNGILYPENPEMMMSSVYFMSYSMCAYRRSRIKDHIFERLMGGLPPVQDLITSERALAWAEQAIQTTPIPKILTFVENHLVPFLSPDQVQIFIDVGMSIPDDYMHGATASLVSTYIRYFPYSPVRSAEDLVEYVSGHEFFSYFFSEPYIVTTSIAVSLYESIINELLRGHQGDKVDMSPFVDLVSANAEAMIGTIVQSLFLCYDQLTIKVLLSYVKRGLVPFEAIIEMISAQAALSDQSKEILSILLTDLLEEASTNMIPINEFMRWNVVVDAVYGSPDLLEIASMLSL